MKKRIFLLPIVLLASLLVFNWGCGEEETNDELCEAFSLPPEYPECEIPTICCPTDEGSCYYVNPDPNGENYYCDPNTATDEYPNGCQGAENSYIDAHCAKKSMTPEKIKNLKYQLTQFTKELMVKASKNSVCI